jgi:hypothetical protein
LTLQEMRFTDDVVNFQAIETHGNNIDAIMGELLARQMMRAPSCFTVRIHTYTFKSTRR